MNWSFALLALLWKVDAQAVQVTAADAAAWRKFNQTQLTPDGRFLVYRLESERAAELIVRSTAGSDQRRFEIPPGSGDFRISASGRWLAFPVGSAYVEVLDLADGTSRFRCNDAREFAFAGRQDEWLACRAQSELTLRRLSTGTESRFSGAKEFAFDSDGQRMAWVDETLLGAKDLVSGSVATVAGEYSGLTWSPKGRALAAFQAEGIVVLTRIDTTRPVRTVYSPQTLRGFPSDYEISRDPVVLPGSRREPLTWREDERGLFFGVRPILRASPPSQADSKVIVWHWEDSRLPAAAMERFPAAVARLDHARKKILGTTDPEKLFSYLSFVSLPDGGFQLLSDPTLPELVPRVRGRYLLGHNAEPYAREANVSLKDHHDYYLVDLHNGQRTLLASKLLTPTFEHFGPKPRLSPDGATVLYLDQGDYIAYDTKTGERTNLTRGLPHGNEWIAYSIGARRDRDYFPLIQGWTKGCSHVLLWDRFDVWAVPLHGGPALNLTVSGRRSSIRYVRTTFEENDEFANQRPYSDGDSCSIDIEEPLYFRVFDTKTRRSGLARRSGAKPEPEVLQWDDAKGRYYRARDVQKYVYRRETAVQSPDYFLVDSRTLKPAEQLTSSNPQQGAFAWSPGARLVDYTRADGLRSMASLHLPAGYEIGKRYPLLVTVYEQQTERLHNYRYPTSDGHVTVAGNIPYWTQRGYAVLEPDVQPAIGQAGKAAVESVIAATQAVVDMGIADAAKLGLEGQSYGGYETTFIITQTNLFAAAVSTAGPTNWWSSYGAGIRPDGRPGSIGEANQPYIEGPWWEHWDAYINNSSLYHAPRIETPLLLIHGDEDGSVAFSQSVELFNALRRMGDKPVVLLHYRNEGHDFMGPGVRRDLTERQRDFFDHLLKGAPAPQWWSVASTVH